MEEEEKEVSCCCEFHDLKGHEKHMMDCSCCIDDTEINEIFHRFARIPWPGGSKKIRIGEISIATTFFLSATISSMILPICDVFIMIIYIFFSSKKLRKSDFFYLYVNMALASVIYYFLKYLARAEMFVVLISFTLTMLLLIETLRGPIHLSEYNHSLVGYRRKSLDVATFPLLLLFSILACDMVFFSANTLISLNVLAVVMSTTIIVMYILSVNEVEALQTVSRTQEDERCDVCNLVCPNHSKHCRICARCTLRFDHHCVWLNTCIGAGNHLTFLLLLIFITMHGVYFLVVRYEHNAYYSPLVDSSVLNGVTLHVIFCVISILGLLLLQLYQLVFLGITTYERIKNKKRRDEKHVESSKSRRIIRFLMSEYQSFAT